MLVHSNNIIILQDELESKIKMYRQIQKTKNIPGRSNTFADVETLIQSDPKRLRDVKAMLDAADINFMCWFLNFCIFWQWLWLCFGVSVIKTFAFFFWLCWDSVVSLRSFCLAMLGFFYVSMIFLRLCWDSAVSLWWIIWCLYDWLFGVSMIFC